MTLPPYRMPPQPLYSESASIPGSATPSIQQMYTHSSKFPIEREVILNNYDKNSKIPILNEYHRKQKSAAASEIANVKFAWTEDRSNRSYSDGRGITRTPFADGINLEYNCTYKTQPMVLDITTGTDSSSISHLEDSNGFVSSSQPKTLSRLHSTPETEGSASKAFSARTYHSIKDMISSRFNSKSTKMDFNAKVSLNNCEVSELPKTSVLENNHANPCNELLQRGVYLADESRNRHTIPAVDCVDTSSIDITKRNQEIREQITNQYRERRVDVGQITNIIHSQHTYETRSAPPQTTDRYDNQEQYSAARPIQSPNIRLLSPGTCEKYVRPSPTNAKISGGYNVDTPTELRSQRQLEGDTKYNAITDTTTGRDSVSSTRSNDQLLGVTDGQDSCAFSNTTWKQKSKSFERLGDNNEVKLDKLDAKSTGPLSGMSSNYEKQRLSGRSDSGRGSTIYSSGKLKHPTRAASSELCKTKGNKDQWTDVVENELKYILQPKSNGSITNGSLSDGSNTPPLLPVSPDVSSDDVTPSCKHKSYNNKVETANRVTSISSSHIRPLWSKSNTRDKMHQRLVVSAKRPENTHKIPSTVASGSIDLDSMIDDDNDTSDDELNISDARAIRKQLESLENMYSEVVKLLGVRKSTLSKYQCPDPRLSKGRLYGSVSSLPSSVSSRPVRDRHRKNEDKKKNVRDIRGINKRFERLESHVVTLARSVAHLSSEMRTQHLMIQEMEIIRNELTNLRVQTNMLTVRSHSIPRFHHLPNNEQMNSSPRKMKKLAKFFGDEPPLLRIFLKKLGYEEYAHIFERELIGLAELPYMSEERLQKLGIPMGPRLRIIQEIQLGFLGTNENTLCIV